MAKTKQPQRRKISGTTHGFRSGTKPSKDHSEKGTIFIKTKHFLGHSHPTRKKKKKGDPRSQTTMINNNQNNNTPHLKIHGTVPTS